MRSNKTIVRLVASLSCLLSRGVAAQGDPPPWVEWATPIGGWDHDGAFGIGADRDGHVYVGGRTRSSDALMNAGFGMLPDFVGGDDALVLKLSPDGSAIEAATSFGGPGFEAIYGLEVTAEGSVVVIGDLSPGFQAPASACSVGPGGNADIFIALLDRDLEVEWFVVFGGTGDEDAVDLDVSAEGVVTVLGNTTSRDLPTTRGALNEGYLGGASDHFVARLRLGSEVECADRLIYVTYVGSAGTDDNSGYNTNLGIHVAADGVVTVAGATTSGASYPMRQGGYRSPSLGGYDVVVQRIRCDASLPRAQQDLYGAVVGGVAEERPKWVGVTDEGLVHVVGWTWSANFPTTGPSQFRGENDIFILEIDPDPDLPSDQQLRVATLLGGSGYDAPGEAVSRPDGSLVIGGITSSGDFPLSCGALGAFARDVNKAFLVEWRRDPESPSGGTIGLSTVLSLGASCDWTYCDRVQKLAWAPDGTLLVCGVLSSRFPFDLPGAVQGFLGGMSDMFVMRLDLRVPRADFSIDATEPAHGDALIEVCLNSSKTDVPSGTEISSRVWDLGEGAFEGETKVCAEIDIPGIHDVSLEVTSDLGHCDRRSAAVAVSCPWRQVMPWTASDIGAVQFGGGSSLRGVGDSGCLDVCAAGRGWTGVTDAFHFVHQSVAGNAKLSAVLGRLDAVRANSGAALMFREGTAEGASFAALAVRLESGQLRVRLLYRDHGAIQSIRGPVIEMPVGLQLERQGQDFVGTIVREVEGQQTAVEIARVTLAGLTDECEAGFSATAALVGDGTAGDRSVFATFCEVDLAGRNGGSFRRGDCNDDGRVDISDAVATLGFLFLGGGVRGCDDACDSNDDGEVNISDPIALLSVLFLGQGAIPPPGMDACGLDPTEDSLGCVHYDACR